MAANILGECRVMLKGEGDMMTYLIDLKSSSFFKPGLAFVADCVQLSPFHSRILSEFTASCTFKTSLKIKGNQSWKNEWPLMSGLLMWTCRGTVEHGVPLYLYGHSFNHRLPFSPI